MSNGERPKFDGTSRPTHEAEVASFTWEMVDDALVAEIALANAALPDDDPRKITRRHVELMWELAELAWLHRTRIARAQQSAGLVAEPQKADHARAEVLQIADALESYLPPIPSPESQE